MKNLDDCGYLILPNFLNNFEGLQESPQDDGGNWLRGKRSYHKQGDFYEEDKNKNFYSRINHPKYKKLHHQILIELEKILEMHLLKSYTCDTYYYGGSELKSHIDEDSCEISVSIQINGNSKDPWPLWFKLSDYEESKVNLNNGDAVVYKGRDFQHWRGPLLSDSYHHQAYFHYVDSQGDFVQFGSL